MNLREQPFLVLVLFLCLAGGVPIMIWATLRGVGQQIDILKKTGRRARNPWQGEDDQLSELNKRVKELKGKDEK